MLARFGPLRERNFSRLWIGQTASAVGDGLTGVALTFGVLAVSDSAAGLGLVLASFMVPRVVFMLVGGVWADRIPRRSLMIGSDVARAGAQAGLAVAALSGTSELWPFVVASAVSGGASAFFQPAVIGLIPQTLSRERLQQGNALLNLSQSTAFMVGPVLSGVVVAAVGPGLVFAFDSLTFLVSAAFLLMLRLPPSPPVEHASFMADLRSGWREVAGRRWLVASLAAFAFGNLAFAGWFVLAPLAVGRSYGGAPDWGLLMGLFGLGGLLGGTVALRWRPVRPLVASFGILLTAPAALLLLSATPPLAVLGGGVVAFAIAIALTNTLWHTTLQQQVPAGSISRVSSYDWMVSLLIFPVGSALAGPMADAFGLRATLLVFAALSGVPLVLVLLSSEVRAIRRQEPGVVVSEEPAAPSPRSDDRGEVAA
jgi:MFS family permease